MKTTIALHTRIQVRAYYLFIAGNADTIANWLAAERTEMHLAAKRSAAAKKAAATRAASKALAEIRPMMPSDRRRSAERRSATLSIH